MPRVPSAEKRKAVVYGGRRGVCPKYFVFAQYHIFAYFAQFELRFVERDTRGTSASVREFVYIQLRVER